MHRKFTVQDARNLDMEAAAYFVHFPHALSKKYLLECEITLCFSSEVPSSYYITPVEPLCGVLRPQPRYKIQFLFRAIQTPSQTLSASFRLRNRFFGA